MEWNLFIGGKIKLETSRFKSEISHLQTKQIAHILHAIQLPFIMSKSRVKYHDQFIRSSYLFNVLHIYLGNWYNKNLPGASWL